MSKFITAPLPQDVPANWNDTMYVSPNGVEVGLSEKHGYNYLAQQVNNAQKAASEAGAVLDYMVGVNLLHNWYFPNPVNQRRKTEYTGVNGWIDRWSSGTAAFKGQLTSSGIVITNTGNYVGKFNQFLPTTLPVRATYTASVIVPSVTGDVNMQVAYTDNTVGASIKLANGLNALTLTTAKQMKSLVFQVAIGASITLHSAKLELGSIQTLAHQDTGGNWVLNEVPNYETELLKCCVCNIDATDPYANNHKTLVNFGGEFVSTNNLLDNWYFGNPVNRRGQSSYSGTLIYTIDRWMASEKLTVENGGITVYKSSKPILRSHVDNPKIYKGKTITFSVLVLNDIESLELKIEHSAGGVSSPNSNVVAGQVVSVTHTLPADKDVTSLYVQCSSDRASTMSFLAAKLELGENQTLAHQDKSGAWILNEIPNKGIETVKCNCAPVELGGIGMIVAPEDIGAASTANTFADAEVIEDE